jgi:muramoyltetrapeptide carboxypeptidase LdcA involved in peptidoglycan recycling
MEPVEYPTTRKIDATPQERAADINAAFADPEIAAIMASIGGDDQIKVLRWLDPAVLQANPKAFFGYSDNTNLLVYLWNLGIISFHGGSTMVHLARPGRVHPTTLESMRRALFEPGEVQLSPAVAMTDENVSWADPEALDVELPMRPGAGWTWAGDQRAVTGPSWGGCLEILDFQLRAGRYLLAPEAYAGCVLLLETSEEMPGAEYVHRVLVGMGERGMLEQFAAWWWRRRRHGTGRWASRWLSGFSLRRISGSPSVVPSMSTTLAYQRYSALTLATQTHRS